MHPFPSVVRWAIFPALAGVAGAAGGAIGTYGERDAVVLAILAGAIGAGAAFASGLARRAWPCLLAAPFAGVWAVAVGMAVAIGIQSGAFPDPARLLERLLGMSSALLLLAVTSFLQSASHRLAQGRPGLAVLGCGIGAGALAFLLALLLTEARWRWMAASFVGAATLAQAPAYLVARAVARRLRPSEAA